MADEFIDPSRIEAAKEIAQAEEGPRRRFRTLAASTLDPSRLWHRPFMFTLHPDGVGLLLKGSWGNIVWTIATAAVGLVALAGGLTGWLLMKTTWLERGLLIAAGLVLVYPSLAQDMIGLGLFALAVALQYLHWRSAADRMSPAH